MLTSLTWYFFVINIILSKKYILNLCTYLSKILRWKYTKAYTAQQLQFSFPRALTLISKQVCFSFAPLSFYQSYTWQAQGPEFNSNHIYIVRNNLSWMARISQLMTHYLRCLAQKFIKNWQTGPPFHKCGITPNFKVLYSWRKDGYLMGEALEDCPSLYKVIAMKAKVCLQLQKGDYEVYTAFAKGFRKLQSYSRQTPKDGWVNSHDAKALGSFQGQSVPEPCEYFRLSQRNSWQIQSCSLRRCCSLRRPKYWTTAWELGQKEQSTQTGKTLLAHQRFFSIPSPHSHFLWS